ncbi:MAG: polysaccharide deacetylase family protein [Clostridia bacterium]|nr:polysaccharide deacetylase family protein [Clostridia bacterium]
MKRNSKLKIFLWVAAIISTLAIILVISNIKSNAEEAENCSREKRLPVLMYHLILKNPGNSNKFIVPQSVFEEDLKYIKNHGYTTILVQDLIDYTENKKELPEKPILLTFDDGAFNNYLYAFPLAKKYEAKFIFSPIAKEAERYTKAHDENPTYSHANWEKISEMSKSGLVEIQNHTYNMHSNKKSRIGCTKKRNESVEEYKQKLSEDIRKSQELISQNTGVTPTAFFYPYGAKSDCSEEILKSLGFKATFLCESKVNIISRNPECLFGLKRFIRPPGVPTEKIFSKFEK